MRIQLSDHFTLRRLLRFTFPSIVMMIFTSIYGVVDGLFVSNFVGKTPFAALNLIMPVAMLLGAFGFMLGTGGSALIAKTLGEGDSERANRYFSMLVKVAFLIGLVLTVCGILFLRPIAALLGAEGEMLEHCVVYGRILLLALIPFMLQNMFQSLLVTAERPKFGLAVTIAAGLTNIVLDFLLIKVLHGGLAAAAWATAISQFIGGVIPLIYFLRPNSSLLRLCRAKFDGRALLRVCLNGSSELMTNVSLSLVNILYNWQLMRLAGEDGVAAYGVIMYVNFVFIAAFLGYSVGAGPIVGYHFGAANHKELKNLFSKSMLVLAVSGLLMTTVGQALALPLSRLFVGYDAALLALTCRALRLYALSFLLTGFNIFGSAFFTALNDGVISAALSFLRTLLFQVAAVLLLPSLLPNPTDGVWLSIVVAEALALAVTFTVFWKKRNVYHYW